MISKDFDIILAPGIIAVEAAEEENIGGILNPDSISSKDQVGIVLAVGSADVYDSNPTVKRTTMVKPGNKIVHSVWSNVALTYQAGRKVRFIRFQDVIGVYKQGT